MKLQQLQIEFLPDPQQGPAYFKVQVSDRAVPVASAEVAEVDPGALHLSSILVFAPHRGVGLGSWLLQRIEERAASRALELVTVEVWLNPLTPTPEEVGKRRSWFARRGYLQERAPTWLRPGDEWGHRFAKRLIAKK